MTTWQSALQQVGGGAERPTYQLREGGVFVVPPAPNASSVPRPVSIVNRLMESVASLERMRATVADDDTLSDVGRERKLSPLRAKVAQAVLEAQRELGSLTGEVQVMRAETFLPPKLAKDDFVAALEDRELRDWLRNMSADERAGVVATMAEQPRLQAAVLRSPIPLPGLSEAAERMFAAHAAKSDPEARRVLQHEETTEWAALVVNQVRDALVGDAALRGPLLEVA